MFEEFIALKEKLEKMKDETETLPRKFKKAEDEEDRITNWSKDIVGAEVLGLDSFWGSEKGDAFRKDDGF